MPRLNTIVNQLQTLDSDQLANVRKNGNGTYKISVENEIDFLSYIGVKVNPSNIRYGIVHIPTDLREFFPGYREQFILDTDLKPFVMHLTGASFGTEVGAEEGGYIAHPKTTDVEEHFLDEVPDADNHIEGTFKRYYDAYPDIQPGDFLTIFKLDSQKYFLRKTS